MGEVWAQQCPTREQALAHLAAKYQEHPVARGLNANGTVIEVLSTDNGATWTILATMPNGRACVLAVGEGWVVLPPGEPA